MRKKQLILPRKRDKQRKTAKKKNKTSHFFVLKNIMNHLKRPIIS